MFLKNFFLLHRRQKNIKKTSYFIIIAINSKKTFWTVDQLGLYSIASKMKRTLKILNFYRFSNILNFNKLIKVSKILEIKKIKAKFNDGGVDE
tara:strand:- start:10 stop:288 length:279 start_codon:yes stop_codon:yes gene_type:complete